MRCGRRRAWRLPRWNGPFSVPLSDRRFHVGGEIGWVPYCSTCTFSSVTKPLLIISSRTGRKALICSSLSTISITSGRPLERRRDFDVGGLVGGPETLVPRRDGGP